VNSVGALHQGNAFFGSPREPHPVFVAFSQQGYVEANAEIAAEDGIVSIFAPAAARIVYWRLNQWEFWDRSNSQGRND
jgi:hypothetical protein